MRSLCDSSILDNNEEEEMLDILLENSTRQYNMIFSVLHAHDVKTNTGSNHSLGINSTCLHAAKTSTAPSLNTINSIFLVVLRDSSKTVEDLLQ